MLRMHRSFKAVGENPFKSGYAIVDPDTPDRVARNAAAMRNRGLIQLCTVVDAWSPEAQEHNLGRRCLESGPRTARVDSADTDQERRP